MKISINKIKTFNLEISAFNDGQKLYIIVLSLILIQITEITLIISNLLNKLVRIK